MTPELIVALFSLVVSAVSVVIAIYSLQRSGIYERFDYAALVDIADEIVQMARVSGERTYIATIGSGVKDGDPSPILIKDQKGFGYRASLVNKGEKTIPIANVYMDYGARDDANKRVQYVLEGRFHLAPGEKRQVEFSLSRSEIDDTIQKYGIQQCLFWFRVTYENTKGKRLDLIRPLGGFEGERVIIDAQAGDSLV